jgi:hypothetical protein
VIERIHQPSETEASKGRIIDDQTIERHLLSGWRSSFVMHDHYLLLAEAPTVEIR